MNVLSLVKWSLVTVVMTLGGSWFGCSIVGFVCTLVYVAVLRRSMGDLQFSFDVWNICCHVSFDIGIDSLRFLNQLHQRTKNTLTQDELVHVERIRTSLYSHLETLSINLRKELPQDLKKKQIDEMGASS